MQIYEIFSIKHSRGVHIFNLLPLANFFEKHRIEIANKLETHYYNMCNPLSRNEGVWISGKVWTYVMWFSIACPISDFPLECFVISDFMFTFVLYCIECSLPWLQRSAKAGRPFSMCKLWKIHYCGMLMLPLIYKSADCV